MSRLLNMTAIKDHIGMSEDTVLDWIRHYNFPARKIKGTWISETELIDDWWKKYSSGESTFPETASAPDRNEKGSNRTKKKKAG